MKNWVLVCMLVLVLSGCESRKDYETFKEAVDRTGAMNSGASQVAVTIENTLSDVMLQQLTPEEKAEMEGLERIEVTLDSRFDRKAAQGITDVYVYSNNLGQDFKIFQKGKGVMYLKLPFSANYYVIDDTVIGEQIVTATDADIQSLVASLGERWNELLQNENVFAGEKVIVKNADGDVKATRYTVKPTEDQLNRLAGQLKDLIVSHQGELAAYGGAMMKDKLPETLEMEDFESAVNAVFNAMTITGYEETAFVDADGYVIEETIKLEVVYRDTEAMKNPFKAQTITIRCANWDIERPQGLDFSEIQRGKTVPLEELKKWSER